LKGLEPTDQHEHGEDQSQDAILDGERGEIHKSMFAPLVFVPANAHAFAQLVHSRNRDPVSG
jgi:hypothetical protein